MYAFHQQYSETHTRHVSLDLAQVKPQKQSQAFDYLIKYRFMYQDTRGDVVSMFDPSHPAGTGAGDVLLTFSGLEGSGFQHCEHTI